MRPRCVPDPSYRVGDRDRDSECEHKSVNLFLISVIIKDKFTDLCGN